MVNTAGLHSWAEAHCSWAWSVRMRASNSITGEAHRATCGVTDTKETDALDTKPTALWRALLKSKQLKCMHKHLRKMALAEPAEETAADSLAPTPPANFGHQPHRCDLLPCSWKILHALKPETKELLGWQ